MLNVFINVPPGSSIWAMAQAMKMSEIIREKLRDKGVSEPVKACFGIQQGEFFVCLQAVHEEAKRTNLYFTSTDEKRNGVILSDMCDKYATMGAGDKAKDGLEWFMAEGMPHARTKAGLLRIKEDCTLQLFDGKSTWYFIHRAECRSKEQAERDLKEYARILYDN